MEIRPRVLIAGLLLQVAAGLQAEGVATIHVKGPIGPATASYIARAIDVAKQEKAVCLVLNLDTPGGLLDSTKEIVDTFYASPVPVVVYVAPSGANAGSAGVFITMAADVAAMAPNTSIGAAHPVSLGPGSDKSGDDVMKQKLENFASSYIEAIAQKRGRNAEWAKSAVRESASITAEKALQLNVIDLIAADLAGLVLKLNGRTVNGKVLNTAGARTAEIPMVARERLFQMLWRPEVMFILMLVAIYGIIAELNNPGAIFPGVVGAIALIVVLYMSAILPLNIAGIALILLAVGLFVLEVFVPSHGILGVGGVVAFFLGALMLFDRADPAFRLSLAYIIPGTLLTAAFVLWVVGAGLRAQRLPVTTGKEAMLGQVATVVTRIDPSGGKVFFDGEYWNAVSDSAVEPGQAVRIVGIDGLTLKVQPRN
jgi:membrane-bound serine protease (ClpP class)